ncbi:MAG: hypothetical protein WBA45_14825 [Microthrixaceae bacterium]
MDREAVSVAFHVVEPSNGSRTNLDLRYVATTSPSLIGVWDGSELLGHVRGENQNDVKLLLEIGLPLAVATNDSQQLTIRLVDIADNDPPADQPLGSADPAAVVRRVVGSAGRLSRD